MSSGRRASGAHRTGSAPTRFVRAWRELPQERRLAVLASLGLFLALFLPWYQETVFANGVTSLRSASSSLTGWGAFSFVEAAVLLVAAAVLVLLFARAEGQAFHVPGGDGGVITAAGFWTCLLIVWRIFDKEGTSRHGQVAYTSGIEWGIFVALGVAAVLTYAGSQIRLSHEPEPPLPGEEQPSGSGGRRRRGWLGQGKEDTRRRATTRRAYPGPDMGAEAEWTQEFRAQRISPEPPTQHIRPEPPAEQIRQEPPAEQIRPEPPAEQVRAEAPTQPQSSETPTRPMSPATPTPPMSPEAPTRRMRPRSISDIAAGAVPARRTRPLDRREIQELDIAEPPTARLGRSAPATAPRPNTAQSHGTARPDPGPDPSEAETQQQRRRPDPDDDQLTIRMDRPD
jgi:hypothetical protein